MYVCVNHCYGMVYIITVSWVYLTLPVHFALIHCLSPDQQLIICWIFIATYFLNELIREFIAMDSLGQ